MRMTILSPEDIDKSKFLLPLYGAEDPDDDDGDDDKDKGKTKSKSKGKDKDDDDDDDDDEDDLDSIEDPQARRVVELSREAARRRREKNAEKKRADTAEAELEKIRNAGKSSEEQYKAELEKEKERNATLMGAVTKNLLKTSILENDKYSWHDVSTVMKEIDHDELEVDVENLVVDGLDEQLKQLAKKKPFLLKTKSSGKEDEDEGGNGGAGGTGHNPRNGGRRTGGGMAQREDLLKKYPSLANR